MNYEKLYFKFIDKFKKQEMPEGTYTEKHHIIPRYRGGSNDKSNLVVLTYEQHVFVHHIWAKATGDLEAIVAYRMMSGVVKDTRLEIARLGGQINKRSGWLDKIRPLANTPERQRKLKILQRQMKEDGRLKAAIDAMHAAWRGCHHTEDFKRNRSRKYKKKFLNDAEYRDKILGVQKTGIATRRANSELFSKSVIENAERNEQFLSKKSNRSLNIFISPEGLSFDSPIFAAGYYGKVEPYVIENWCKREQHGWRRIPKSAQE